MIQNELQLLEYITISLVGILFTLLIYLVGRKTVEIQNKKKIAAYKEKISQPIFVFLNGGPLTKNVNFHSKLRRKALEEILSKFSEILEGTAEKGKLTQLAELYLSDNYLNDLRSRKWSKRINALYHIEDFHMKELEKEIVQVANKKKISSEERIQSIKILASFQYEDIYNLITSLDYQLSEYEYRNILIRLNQNLFEGFILSFYKSETTLKLGLLDVLGIKKELRYLSFLKSVYASNTGELRLRALKAIIQIGYIENLDYFLPLYESTQWQERMLIAKLFGVNQEPELIPILIELIHDPSWWVRTQAGESILRYKKGKEILAKVFETSTDPFARDMAWEWMNRGD